MMWWIGYSDQANEGDWRWLDCTESSDWQNELWAPGNPGNGRLDCAALQPDGQITSIVCDTSISFLCEVSPKGFSQDDANVQDVVAMGASYGVQVTWTVSPTSCDVVAYRIYYNVAGDISTRKSITVYGGDTSSALVSGLPVDTEYEIRVAAYLSKDIELSPVGPAVAKTLPCPSNYELAPNGRCYRFIDDDDDFWHYGRSICMGATDSDLAIVNDEAELAYIMDRINASSDTGAWWIGYSDISVEGDWRWVDCTAPNDWQTSLWAPGSPGNGMLDCAALTRSGEIEAKVCDVSLNVVCEVSPKGFDRYGLQVENLEVVGSSYGFKASWDLPAYSCDIYGFRIDYRVANGSDVETMIVYGGDVTSAQVTDLRPNTTVTVSVAILIVDSELEATGGITVQTDPCPPKYHEAANGHCYFFSDFGRFGQGWDDCRSYCNEDTGNFDHDLVVIDDEWELEYVTNMTRMFNDSRDWWIGYSDVAVESSWKWVTCESSDAWQESLWSPGYPGNGLDDCGLFIPANMTIYDATCDVPNKNYICEVTPKSFAIGDDNVRNLNATAISWDTIRVTWDVSEFNCDVIAYFIYYLDTAVGGTPTSELIYGGGVTSYDIQGLWASTRYSVSVAAARTNAYLPAVDPVYVTTPEGPCPAYYDIGTNGRCYRFFANTYGDMWTEGRDDCDDTVDSDLVVIDDEMELEYILNRTRAMDSARDWWIGLSDISVESDWRWVTCAAPTDWQNTLWGPGYPSSAINDCAALNAASGEVVDAVCDEKKYFVCEVTPKGFTNADMNVRGTEATPLSLTQIKVTWALSNVTCNVYGYHVYYETSQDSNSVVVYGGNETSVTIGDLTPSTTYFIYVAALIPDRLELPRIGPANATTLSECGRTDISKNGTIQNPDYPNGYPGGETCDWLISAPTNEFVLLQITDFDTKLGVDFVVIGSGNDFDPTSTLYTLSGSMDSAVTPSIPGKVLSPGQYLWVSFRTSQTTTEFRGFQMTITMVTQGPATPDRDYVETTEEGVLSSPGWPIQYNNLQDITWTLIAPKTGRVRITSLEGSLEDGYDTLTVGSGQPDSNELATYTGDIQFNGPLESETYAMWVRFVADETISDTGFKLFWESFDDQNECGSEELTDPTGVITSPNYPNPYPDNQICTWEIRLPDTATLVRVVFTAFSLEENEDFLQVGSGQTVGENVVASLTGSGLPSPVESATYRMWLRFLSDESFSDTGFSLNYYAVENPDPPTPYEPETDSVLFIVQNEPEGWFTPVQQTNLANAIAQSMTDFCAGTSCGGEPEMATLERRDVGTLAMEFSADDVEFLSYFAVENNLHIITWIQNPDTAEDDFSVGIDPDVVMTALLDENSQTTIREYMGEGFSYNVTHVPDTPEPTTPPPEGLEPWAIALIVLGSLTVIVGSAVTLEVMCREKPVTDRVPCVVGVDFHLSLTLTEKEKKRN
ncbi:uncharacterized protein [Diadema setosum]|uniref:uncharacterized protein n=1 Tax=Diadema setosum TaxID=31175 RepID=UPI003B3A6A13